jgi:hypothetical protein
MSTLTVIGGTGYAGRAVVDEAVRRGHSVTVLARSEPSDPVAGASYVVGSALDPDALASGVEGADAVVSAAAARGDMAERFAEYGQRLIAAADAQGARLVVIGGFSSLRPAPGAPRFIEGEVAEQYVVEATAGHRLLEALMASPTSLDYVFVSPAAKFGAWAPGESTGAYRLSDDVAILDRDGSSRLSAPDMALAILDVIESGDHARGHISVVE